MIKYKLNVDFPFIISFIRSRKFPDILILKMHSPRPERLKHLPKVTQPISRTRTLTSNSHNRHQPQYLKQPGSYRHSMFSMRQPCAVRIVSSHFILAATQCDAWFYFFMFLNFVYNSIAFCFLFIHEWTFRLYHLLSKRFYLFTFIKKGREGGREGEKHQLVTSCMCPDRGPNL